MKLLAHVLLNRKLTRDNFLQWVFFIKYLYKYIHIYINRLTMEGAAKRTKVLINKLTTKSQNFIK